MKEQHSIEEWLKKARRNLARANPGKRYEAVLYEDPCFDCQQVVEKSLKGLLAHAGVDFPWTHSISNLLELIEKTNMDIPEYVRDSVILTVYATSTRYPSNQEPVDEDEYKEAVQIAERVYYWVEGKQK